jgi:sphingosine kinase
MPPGSPSPDVPKPTVYLEETFYVLVKKNTVFRVRLTDEGLSLSKEGDGTSKEQTISVRDMVGCKCVRGAGSGSGAACACTSLGRRHAAQNDESEPDSEGSDPSAYLHVYAYKLKGGIRGDGRRRTSLTLRFRSFDRFEDNNKEALKWRTAIKCLIDGRPVDLTPPPPRLIQDERRLLVILNPKSGKGKAREAFQRAVSPVFFEAEIPYDLQVSLRLRETVD